MVNINWIDANQDLANNRFAGHHVASPCRRAEIGDASGQDQKTAVVADHLSQSCSYWRGKSRPINGSRTAHFYAAAETTEQSHSLLAIAGDVSQGVTDLGRKPTNVYLIFEAIQYCGRISLLFVQSQRCVG